MLLRCDCAVAPRQPRLRTEPQWSTAFRHMADLIRPGWRAGAITRGSGAGRRPLRTRVSSAERSRIAARDLKRSWSHYSASHICLCSHCNTKTLAGGTNFSPVGTHDHG